MIFTLPVLNYPLGELRLEERKRILNTCAPQQPTFDNVGTKNGNVK